LDEGRLTQAEAARILGVCERSFRRYMVRYETDGLDGLIDRRLEQVSNRQALVDEVMGLTSEYRSKYIGWNVKHFHSLYKRTDGKRSYTWVKRRLQEAGLVPKFKKHGAHRKWRERSTTYPSKTSRSISSTVTCRTSRPLTIYTTYSDMFLAWSPMRSMALAMNRISSAVEIVRGSSIMKVMR
jgi:transposase